MVWVLLKSLQPARTQFWVLGSDDLTWVIMDGLTEYIRIHRYVGSLQNLAAGKYNYVRICPKDFGDKRVVLYHVTTGCAFSEFSKHEQLK